MANLYVSDSGGQVQVAEVALIAGKEQMVLGDFNRDLILRTKGNLQVQVGNKFYTLNYNPTASTSTSTNLVVSSTTTILNLDSDLAKLAYPGDGDYVFVKQSGSFYIASGGNYVKLNDTVTTGDTPSNVVSTANIYLSYASEQDLTGTEKLQVSLNIGNINTFNDITSYTKTDVYLNQLLYSITDGKHYKLINYSSPSIKASWQELYLSLPNGGNVLSPVAVTVSGNSITTYSALHITGDAPVVYTTPTTPTPLLTIGASDYSSGLAVWTNTGDVYFNLLNSSYQSGYFFEAINSSGVSTTPLSISNNSVAIAGPLNYTYALSITGATFLGSIIQSSSTKSTDFLTGFTGFGITKDSSSNWTIEADYIIARKGTTTGIPVYESKGLNGVQVLNYDVVLTEVDYHENFPVYINASSSGHYTDTAGTVRPLSARATRAKVIHTTISTLDSSTPTQAYELITLSYAVGDTFVGGAADTTTTYNQASGGSYYTPQGNISYDSGTNSFIPNISGPLLEITNISVYYIRCSNILNVGDLLYHKAWDATKGYLSAIRAEVVSTTADGGYYVYVYDGAIISIGTKLVVIGNTTSPLGTIQFNASETYSPYVELASGITSFNDLSTNYYYDQSTDMPAYDFIQEGQTQQTNTRVKIGDLSNIVSTQLGLTTQQYGIYSDNVYLKGNFVLNSAVFTAIPTVTSYENFIMLHSDNTLEQVNMATPFAYWNAKADQTITILPSGSGILGGGNLTANRTFSLDFTYLDNRYLKYARNAANFGQTASLADVGHYVDPGLTDNTYRVGAWVNLLALTGGDSLTVQVSYTDEHGASKTKYFYQQGSTTSALTAIDDYPFSTMDFRALSGSTIQVSTTVAGTGTILYDVGCTIQLLIGN